MDADKLQQILKDHLEFLETGNVEKRANLRYADLSYADLSYANLSYADLRYADLRYADLRYADLSYADLSYANLRYANLSYADLSYADNIYNPIQIINTKYFITILHNKVLWGCKEFTHDEVKELSLTCCESEWNEEEFELNKKTIIEHIDFYFGKEGINGKP